MSVGINEAREKRGVAKVDELCVSRNFCGSADSRDLAAGHNNEAWRNDGVALTIEESSRLQDISLGGRFLSLSESRRPQNKAAEKTAQNFATHVKLLWPSPCKCRRAKEEQTLPCLR